MLNGWKSMLLVCGLLSAAAMTACARANNDYFRPSEQKIELPDFPPVEEVIVETADGEALFAWQLDALEGCPTILMLHGRTGHIGRGTHKYRKVYEAGIGLLALSWRGYAGSTGTPSEEGLFRDAEAGYEFLRAQGRSADDIVVHGFSLGTGPATKLASDVELAALVLEAPALSILSLYRERYPDASAARFSHHEFRSDRYIKAVSEPILMVHGDADTAIPPHHSAQLAELASAPVKRVIVPGGTHTSLVADGLYENVIWPYLQPSYPDCSFSRNSKATSK